MGIEDIFYRTTKATVNILGDYYTTEQNPACVCLIENLFTAEEVENMRIFTNQIEFTAPTKVLVSPGLAARIARRIIPLVIIENGKQVLFNGVSSSVPFCRVANGINSVNIDYGDCILWQIDSDNGVRLTAGHSDTHSITAKHALLVPRGVKISLIPHLDNEQCFIVFKLNRA
jgi:hypothetical protein